MILTLRLAFRNLQRNLRRSLITVMSIGFGLAVILWLQAILAGSNQNVIDTITSTHYGHMQIFRKDYRESGLIQQTFPLAELNLDSLGFAELKWAPRLHLPALISSGEQSFPIVLEGIDPAREGNVTRVREHLRHGQFLADQDPDCSQRQVYISERLAKLLNVELGNKLVILAQAADGSMGNELLRIQGLFATGSPEYDKSVVFTHASCVEKIGALQGVHEIAVHLDRGSDEGKIKNAAIAVLPPELVILNWREAQPQLAGVIKFNDASLVLVSVMLFIVISLGILNTFLVTVFQRTKEFGVMMALGTSPGRIVALVMTEGFFLGLAASLLGIVTGFLVIFYHYQMGFDLTPLVGDNLSVGVFQLKLRVHPIIHVAGAVKAVVITLVAVIVSVIYPAVRAACLKPIEAIRTT